MAFIGLDTGLFDTKFIDIKRFFEGNYFDSTDVLKSLLSRYCTMLAAVWARIAKNMKNNFLHSLSASTYFKDTKVVPRHQSDYLKAYPLNEDRLRIVLNRVYPSITRLIKDLGYEEEFFKYCDFDLTPKKDIIDIETAIDGIVSLLLLCFCCCQTSLVDEELDRLKKQYRTKLQELIRKKFDYIPPSEDESSLFNPEVLQMELQRLLALRNQLLGEGQYAHATVTHHLQCSSAGGLKI